MSKPILSVKGGSKRFGGLVALSKVSLEAHEGEVLGLMGPNGAGKTTLLNVISGVYPADEGTITFDEHDITGLPPHKVCHLGIARTFQIPRPFSGLTTRENLLVPGIFGRRISREQVLRDCRRWFSKSSRSQGPWREGPGWFCWTRSLRGRPKPRCPRSLRPLQSFEEWVLRSSSSST